MTTFMRATFDGKVLIPLGPVDLRPGQEVELRVTDATDPPRGSPAAVLNAMSEGPPLPKEWVDELERAIDEGKTPPAPGGGVFDDLR